MKCCPDCRRDYYDETLLYCLDDGARLIEGPTTADVPATAIFHSSAVAEEPTRAQIPSAERSGVASEPKAKGFDKRLMRAPLAMASLSVTRLEDFGFALLIKTT